MPIAALLALFLAAEPAKFEALTVVQRPYAPFISPMGEPFHSQAAGDDPLARWFYQADSNRDGQLSVDELRADADRYFKVLDSNRDGEIDPDEIRVYETDIASEVQVNSKWKRSRQAAPAPTTDLEQKPVGHRGRHGPGDNGIDGYQQYGLQGAARYGLLNLPEPVAGADADFNRSITAEEFKLAAARRFQLLDTKGAGRLVLQDLEARLPTRPGASKHGKTIEYDKDTRVGQPFPGN